MNVATGAGTGGLKTFDTLQVGRGLAAIMVVLFHIGILVGEDPDLWQRHRISEFTVVGFYGVDFFFILSGIVILLAHWKDIQVPSKIPVFFWKRFRRIYPIYWALMIPVLLKNIAVHSPKMHNPWIVASNMVLLHLHTLTDIMGASWTLYHEVLFYLLFSILLYKRYLGIAVLAGWLGTSAFFFNHAAVLVNPVRYTSFLFTPLHILFAFGMLVAFAIHHKYVSRSVWMFAGGLAVFLASLGFVVHAQTETLWIRLLGDLGLAVGIWAAMGIELTHVVKFPAFFKLLGNASYAIYLSNPVILSSVSRTLYAHDHRLHTPIGLAMILMFVPAVLFGIAVHLWIEVPLVRLLTKAKKGTVRPIPEPSVVGAGLQRSDSKLPASVLNSGSDWGHFNEYSCKRTEDF